VSNWIDFSVFFAYNSGNNWIIKNTCRWAFNPTLNQWGRGSSPQWHTKQAFQWIPLVPLFEDIAQTIQWKVKMILPVNR